MEIFVSREVGEGFIQIENPSAGLFQRNVIPEFARH
jgi:hypothetical protein